MFTFRTWTVSQCAALPEIHNFVFDWEAEAHIHHLVVAFLTWWFCMVHLLLSLRNPDWSKFTLLRQMINCERGIELERIIGNHTSLLVFTERWRMKCLFYYICQYGSVAIIFSTLPVSNLFNTESSHTLTCECDCRSGWKTVWRVDWNLPVCECIHSCDTVVEAFWGGRTVQTLWGESCDILHENTVFCERVYEKKMYFSKLSILAVCHRVMWGWFALPD